MIPDPLAPIRRARYWLIEPRLPDSGPHYFLKAVSNSYDQALMDSQEYGWFLWDTVENVFIDVDRSERIPGEDHPGIVGVTI